MVVGHQTRLGKVTLSKPQQGRTPTGIHRVVDGSGRLVWRKEEDDVQCIVLLRKGEDSLPALKDVEAKVEELNDPNSGQMLPGVKIEPYYDRTDLINVTTETVHENLFMGMMLVMMILLMFLSNVRSALIVAINIPLALLFAFSMLFLRGKSANLLSIGAVDFGIIVDSSVIMVENIYRHLSSGEHSGPAAEGAHPARLPEVEKPLLFSTLIMVCAFLPLFTMQGPEGQIFGPMADTYAFALGGALVLAVMLAPVLCLLFFKNLQPAEDNFLVRWLKSQLPAAAGPLPALPLGDVGPVRGPVRRHGRVRRAPARPRVHAGAGRGQSVDSRHVPAQHLARTATPRVPGRLGHIMASYPGGRKRRQPDRPARRRHRLRRLLQLRVLRAACGRRRSGPPSVEQTGWRRWLFGAKRPRTKDRAGRRR